MFDIQNLPQALPEKVTQSSGWGEVKHMEGKDCIYPSHSELPWGFFHSHNPLLLTKGKNPTISYMEDPKTCAVPLNMHSSLMKSFNQRGCKQAKKFVCFA